MKGRARGFVLAGVGLAAAAALAAWAVHRSSRGRDVLPVLWPAPHFALVDQTGGSLEGADLRGYVWIASFVFTNCTDVCPLVSARMAGLRDSLDSSGWLGSRVRLVSISVDPERDTPEVLREYARRFGGSPPSDWAFLTGSSGHHVRRLIQDGFRLAAVLDEREVHAGHNYQVTHSPRLALVDARGRVRGTYDSTQAEAMESLLRDLRRLVSDEESN